MTTGLGTTDGRSSSVEPHERVWKLHRSRTRTFGFVGGQRVAFSSRSSRCDLLAKLQSANAQSGIVGQEC